MKKTLKRELDVHPIMTPNFILVGEDKTPLPITDFSYEEVEELCQEFTKKMHGKREQGSRN